MNLRGKGDTYAKSTDERVDGIADRGEVRWDKKIIAVHFIIDGVDRCCQTVYELDSCKLGEFHVDYRGEMRRTGSNVAIIVFCSWLVCLAVPTTALLKLLSIVVTEVIFDLRVYQAHIRDCETAGAGSPDCA